MSSRRSPTARCAEAIVERPQACPRVARSRSSCRLHDGRLYGQVTDDGRGFEVAAALERSRRQRQMGLDTIRERLPLAGRGSVEVTSIAGSGTVVSFELPVDTA